MKEPVRLFALITSAVFAVMAVVQQILPDNATVNSIAYALPFVAAAIGEIVRQKVTPMTKLREVSPQAAALVSGFVTTED